MKRAERSPAQVGEALTLLYDRREQLDRLERELSAAQDTVASLRAQLLSWQRKQSNYRRAWFVGPALFVLFQLLLVVYFFEIMPLKLFGAL